MNCESINYQKALEHAKINIGEYAQNNTLLKAEKLRNFLERTNDEYGLKEYEKINLQEEVFKLIEENNLTLIL